MGKKIQLTIAEPCHENWDGMTPVEKGRFCGSCQKQVVDFSDMSDRQVAEFFKKPSTGSVCGRFMTDQLDRAIEIPKKRMPWVKYFFQIALPAFLVSMKVSASKTQGEIKVNKISSKDTTKKEGVFADTRITLGMVARPKSIKPFMGDTIVTPVKEPIPVVQGEIAVVDKKNIPVCTNEIIAGTISIVRENRIDNENRKNFKGQIINEQGEPVPFASIETGKPRFIFVADENGRFVIKKDSFFKEKKIIVSSVGFESKEVSITKTTDDLLVELKSSIILPEVVVSTLGQVRMGKTLGYTILKGQVVSIINEKEITANKEVKLPVEENSLLIYPNPIQSGATLNLSFKKMDEGYYQLQIISQSGQLVKQQEIWIDAEARLLNIDVPLVAAGSYFMVLTNKKTGKKFTEKIVVQ